MNFDGQEIKDASGRSLVLRKPNILDNYYLRKAMGEDSNNQSLFNMMIWVIYVAKIDGQIFESPKTYQECLAALKRLGEDGISAVIKAIDENTDTEKEAKDNLK